MTASAGAKRLRGPGLAGESFLWDHIYFLCLLSIDLVVVCSERLQVEPRTGELATKQDVYEK